MKRPSVRRLILEKHEADRIAKIPRIRAIRGIDAAAKLRQEAEKVFDSSPVLRKRVRP